MALWDKQRKGKQPELCLGAPRNESHEGAREAPLAGACAHRQEGPGMGDQGSLEHDFAVSWTGFRITMKTHL